MDLHIFYMETHNRCVRSGWIDVLGERDVGRGEPGALVLMGPEPDLLEFGCVCAESRRSALGHAVTCRQKSSLMRSTFRSSSCSMRYALIISVLAPVSLGNAIST